MSELHSIDDPGRLNALYSYDMLDTPSEFEFDALTELAAEICGFPVALISLMSENRQWFKANYGLPGLVECPPEISICSTTICSNELLYVPNLSEDSRFNALPAVASEPHLRAYCGMPMINREGYALGTLCIMDFETHELTPAKREAIRRLTSQAMSLLELRRSVKEQHKVLAELSSAKKVMETAREKTDQILRSVFPGPIVKEMETTGKVEPRFYELASIMFVDFKDSTSLTEGMEPKRLIQHINDSLTTVDNIVTANGVVTLRTMGDGSLCVAGVPEASQTHPVDICLAALQIQQKFREKNRQRNMLRLPAWKLRIGINTGSVVAGVVGQNRITYEIWGSAVNAAARLEQECEPDSVNISASTKHYIDAFFETTARGQIQIKNMGAVDMYFLDRLRPEFSADEQGTIPNESLINQLKSGA